MLTLEKIAKDNAVFSVWCHAQESAIPFYEKLEYKTEGDKFIEAEIVHQIMTKEIDCEMAV